MTLTDPMVIVPTEPSIETWRWILGFILVVVIIAGGVYLHKSNREEKPRDRNDEDRGRGKHEHE